MKKCIIILLSMFLCVNAFAQIDLVRKAAEGGDIDAQKYLGEIFFIGKDGVKKDTQESYKWFLEAAKRGDAEAQYKVAMFKHDLYGRWNSNEEISEMLDWLVKSSSNGYAPAQEHFAFFLSRMGKEAEAFKVYNDAVEQSYPPAFLGLGDCYYYGIGTERNLSEAMRYYQAAADAGIPKANLGLAYCAKENGNYSKAKEYFQKAMDAGIPQAYNDMAYLYVEAKGVDKNMHEAHRLVDIAISKSGNELNFLDSKGEFFLLEDKTEEAVQVWEQIKKRNLEYAQSYDSYFCNKMRSYMEGNVDVDIVETAEINQDTYVVILANENYKREAQVPFAQNDGFIFNKYCRKTLGIPEAHMKYIPDATYNDIRYAVNWLKQVIHANNGQAKVIFYYAGHGIPDEAQKTAYLLPVDGYGSDVTTGYSLKELYETLGRLPSKSVVVFLDACFSGAKREGGMLASARGVAIKVKPSTPVGNLIVFSAAQGDETAYPYKDQKHGMFTYFLLKKMQETKGDIVLGTLSQYVTEQVRKQSIALNGKMQTPTVTAPAILGNTWKEWKLK